VAIKKDILTIVGSNIRKVRLSQKMSQNQLAFEAGVTREFVNKVESGNYNISLKNLEKLALILEVEVKDLFDI
jgi:transcriptional regulator with XRE-family HTH domain